MTTARKDKERLYERIAGLAFALASILAFSTPSKGSASDLPESSTANNPEESRYLPKVRVSKLRTIDLPAYQCKLLFTNQYQRQGGNPSYTMYGYDNPHGQYMFMCLSMPPHVNVSPLLLKPLMEKMISSLSPTNKAEQKEKPIKLQGCQGLEYQLFDQKNTAMKLQAYCSGRRIYIVGLMGTKPYVTSSIGDKFFDSFQITQ
ncbi:MAG: hypothetical protein K2X93_07550 [Candidatus Obscuribacterales bacterium]|nr:hypothetical protein [Candidatus Obscuribacterales bacterium]